MKHKFTLWQLFVAMAFVAMFFCANSTPSQIQRDPLRHGNLFEGKWIFGWPMGYGIGDSGNVGDFHFVSWPILIGNGVVFAATWFLLSLLLSRLFRKKVSGGQEKGQGQDNFS